MKVFLSYSHEDRDLAHRVAVSLSEAGLTVWDPAIELLPGDPWARKIDQALEESDAMVVLLTPRAIDSPWVRREIEYALGEVRFENKLIPVLVDSQSELLADKIPWILRRLKLVELSQDDPHGPRQIARVLLEAA